MKKNLFQKLLHENKDRIFSYAFYVLRNREDAEDVTQEVFIKLWRHLEKIDMDRSAGWLMKVTHNQCINLTRKRKRSRRNGEGLDKMTIETLPAKANVDTDPGIALNQKETQEALLSALERLPVKTRSMMILHYYHGLKYQTIGEILNIKVNTIKVDIHRGKKLLKDILAREFPERARGC
jgi:RNA polymerase sigma-70 factor (ECF subfamily)